jgi:hypothetical protein
MRPPGRLGMHPTPDVILRALRRIVVGKNVWRPKDL